MAILYSMAIGTVSQGKYQEMTLKATCFLHGKDYLCPDVHFQAIELFFATVVNDNAHPINKEPIKHDGLGWFDPKH